jgi:hypothetical protein
VEGLLLDVPPSFFFGIGSMKKKWCIVVDDGMPEEN